MSKKKTRLMRVPNSFYERVKKISLDDGCEMTQVLESSGRILENAHFLTDLIGFTLHKRKKRK